MGVPVRAGLIGTCQREAKTPALRAGVLFCERFRSRLNNNLCYDACADGLATLPPSFATYFAEATKVEEGYGRARRG